MNNDIWRPVEAALESARGIAWDGCHKIYVLLDDEQVALMRMYGYDWIWTDKSPAEYLALVKEWFEESCGLRFVNSVRTVESNPNDGYHDLIAQFEADEDGEEW